ncbi:MAG: TonB-dependent receptor [Rhodobacteraceae bacterium]|nr:TonB-dependent receptor [Paracoccaceae bacterium]
MRAATPRCAPARQIATILLLSTSLTGPVGVSGAFAQEAAATHSYAIAPQPLSTALVQFSRASNLQVFVDDRITAGLQSNAVNGALSADVALARLLSGSGLNYRFTNANTVTITGGPVATPVDDLAPDGTILLDPITVIGGTGQAAVYTTPGAVANIPGERIERFRGSSPADMFRSTPGVSSGEARNGAGAIDPNIRGMQGMGRVQTTVDGAENSLLVYQGYQGVSNRSYVDPDFIAGVDIEKGANISSFGNAGNIAMRTVSAEDIVRPGRKTGFRFNVEASGNTSDPVAGSRSGYTVTNQPREVGTAVGSPTGMNRPSALKPTSSSWSMIGAIQDRNFDFLAGYARRERGNYHAGTKGPAVTPVFTGPRERCWFTTCFPGEDYLDYVELEGIAPYRAGEEVLNSQSATESWLIKSGLSFGDGHSLRLSYTGFRGENGDVMASRQTLTDGSATQREQMTETDLDSVSLHYSWRPAESNLIDFRASFYWTGLEQRNAPRGGGRDPVSVGLPADFLPGSKTEMMGAELSNTSRLFTGMGNVKLEYGVSWRMEDTRPIPGTRDVETWLDLRDARRHEALGYVRAEWEANDWLTLTGGLRYQHYWSRDRNIDPFLPRRGYTYGAKLDGGAWGGSLGVAADVTPNLQVYANYSNTARMPNLFESSSAFSFNVNANARPERSRNWEIGANYTHDGVFTADDNIRVKLGYFNSTVDDYLARVVTTQPFLIEINNIHKARFAGLELATTYETGGFTADFAANYYTKVEFCRTASTCEGKSLYGDYATNQVPPKYSLSLSLTQKLMDDRLTLGGQVTRTGRRAIGHGDVTAAGASSFISLVDWEAHTLADVFVEYKISDSVNAHFRVENLTDAFYVDPLSLVTQPGPGRTFSAGLRMQF